MTDAPAGPEPCWADAELGAALCAVAPAMLGGVVLRGMAGPVRDLWLEQLRELLPADEPMRRVPLHITEGRLLGGLDLTATLSAGRPIAEQGLLAESTGGVLVLAMAERAARVTVAHLAAAMDFGEILLERDGLSRRTPARIGAVALDESLGEEEQLAPVLADRLALYVDLRPLGIHDVGGGEYDQSAVLGARARLPTVSIGAEELRRLCGVAQSLGIASLRPSMLAARVARISAALHDRDQVEEADLLIAARLVLAPRATVLPLPEQPDDQMPEEQPPPEPPEPPDQDETPPEDADNQAEPLDGQKMEDRVLEAALAAIPPNLLARLKAAAGKAMRGAQTPGKSGTLQRSNLRGRPMGSLRGDPRFGARLSLIDTLRVAAPWQGLRRSRRSDSSPGESAGNRPRVLVQRDDFRVARFKQRSETTTIFVVDASGSAALHRLAEAKGAVELLLADCYVRRDQVALIAFRGQAAELLLPPTRSLVRAKRSLAALPGGGGTPLASGVDAAAMLSDLALRRGGTPTVIMLTDGRANIALDGTQGREQAFNEALEAAAALRVAGVRCMVIDTSPRPHANAERLAEAMQGTYLPLPHADARTLSLAVQGVGRGAGH